jgi:hypothetical protein
LPEQPSGADWGERRAPGRGLVRTGLAVGGAD